MARFMKLVTTQHPATFVTILRLSSVVGSWVGMVGMPAAATLSSMCRSYHAPSFFTK